jgi:hypothetical protein
VRVLGEVRVDGLVRVVQEDEHVVDAGREVALGEGDDVGERVQDRGDRAHQLFRLGFAGDGVRFGHRCGSFRDQLTPRPVAHSGARLAAVSSAR